MSRMPDTLAVNITKENVNWWLHAVIKFTVAGKGFMYFFKTSLRNSSKKHSILNMLKSLQERKWLCFKFMLIFSCFRGFDNWQMDKQTNGWTLMITFMIENMGQSFVSSSFYFFISCFQIQTVSNKQPVFLVKSCFFIWDLRPSLELQLLMHRRQAT